jgi:hypothetical protein
MRSKTNVSVDMSVSEKITRLKTPEDAEQFARNVEKAYPDLARGGRRRAVELRAEAYGAQEEPEKCAIRAIYAYEAVLTARNGKKTRATHTWQLVKRHGVIGAIERAVNRPKETSSVAVLKEMGMEDLAFEAVVLKYPDLFTFETLEKARGRINAPAEEPAKQGG